MSVTGTKSSGSDFVGMNEALRHLYTGSVNNTIEGESEVLSSFADAGDFETTDGPDGKQINIEHYMAGGGGISGMDEDSYYPDSTPPVVKNGYITIPQLGSRVDISGRVLRRVKSGPTAFANWADTNLTERAKRIAFHKDRMALGTGTGIIGRINGAPDGTGDAIDSAFGIAGLEGALNLFLRQDALRYSSAADGSGLRTGVVIVDSINYNASTFSTTVSGAAGTATSAADNDYVALGSTNVNSFGRESMGLEGMLDDGTNLATFQGLTRASYPDVLNAQIINSTTSYSGVLSEDLLDYAAAQAWERAGGKVDLILVNRSGQRSFWKSMRGDRVLNDPQGAFTGGKSEGGLKVFVGDRIVTLKAARKVPSSRCYGIDRSTVKRFRVGPGKWDDTSGSIWKQVQDGTGVKDAVYALWVEEEQLANFHPAKSFKLTDLAAA